MPALTTLTIDDGQATPVAHQFEPQGMVQNVARFVYSDGVPIGDYVLTMSSSHRDRHKVNLRLKLPITVTETVNGVDSERVDRTSYLTATFDFASNSTWADRDNALAFLVNALDHADVRKVVKELKDWY